MTTVELTEWERGTIVSCLSRQLDMIEPAIAKETQRSEIDVLCEAQETICAILGKLGVVHWIPNDGGGK